MVEFCPECSSLLRKSTMDGNSVLTCKCGYQKEIDNYIDNKEIEKKIEQTKKELEENLIIVTEEDKVSVNLKVDMICSKCEHKEAETWQEQTRSADEPSTHFFRCLKCKFTWREY
ncbi:MAG: transcription factor S [Candidatus Lokiarchaeota archaeon]|nr:transcription factor S [Candidatus Lokiarchaeota archaeon]